MKILVVNSSAFPKSVVENMCIQFEGAALNIDIQTQRINLFADMPPICDGTYTFKGEFSELQKLVLSYDGLFIGTPCHWFNMPAVLKNFIDHLTPIDSFLWKKSRPLCLAVYAPEGGEFGVLSSIILPFNLMGFSLPANGFAYYNGNDRWAYDEIKEMPKRMLEIADLSL